jgi:hypothetical protein
MKSHTAERLIRELLNDPNGFSGRGDDYKLLQEFFDGFPVEELRPLLAHNHRAVRRAVVWLVSELGKEARPLINEALPLLADSERYVRAYALDIIAVCAIGEDADKYVHVIRLLEDADEIMRVQAMFLVSNAEISQLQAAVKQANADFLSSPSHRSGLSLLLTEHLDVSAASTMIHSSEPLLRKYGAIAAWRFRNRFPELFLTLEANVDPDVRSFWSRRQGRGSSLSQV